MEKHAQMWRTQVSALLRAQAEATGRVDPPIDLHDLAKRCNASIEERDMIPEAVIQPLGDGFRIYLQKNFMHRPGMRARQRFSLAHEIAHTFFFERRGGVMKPKPAPRGAKLEAACQRAAGCLLIPDRYLHRALPDGSCAGAEEIITIARECQVSVEAVIHRLQGINAFTKYDFAPVVVHQVGSEELIALAHYPVWLREDLPMPAPRSPFVFWFDQRSTNAGGSTIVQPDGSRLRATRRGDLFARPVGVSPSVRIYELRMRLSPVPQPGTANI